MSFSPATHDGDSILRNGWTDLELTPLAGSATHVGNIVDGRVRVVNQTVTHMANDTIQMPDLVLRVAAGIEMECSFEEHNVANWSMALGLSIAATNQYLSYVAGTGATTYMTLRAYREYEQSGFQMICYMKKATNTIGSAELGSNIGGHPGTAVKFQAMRDSAGTYGDAYGGTNKLGWLYMKSVASTAQL